MFFIGKIGKDLENANVQAGSKRLEDIDYMPFSVWKLKTSAFFHCPSKSIFEASKLQILIFLCLPDVFEKTCCIGVQTA